MWRKNDKYEVCLFGRHTQVAECQGVTPWMPGTSLLPGCTHVFSVPPCNWHWTAGFAIGFKMLSGISPPAHHSTYNIAISAGVGTGEIRELQGIPGTRMDGMSCQGCFQAFKVGKHFG